MNFDKKKDRPLFQRTVESGCIQFCRELIPDFFRCMFPILPLLFDIRSAVSQLPDFRDAGKAGCPSQIPAGCRAVFRPVQRISQYDANALQPLPCIYAPSRRTLVRRDGEIFQRTSQPFAGGGTAAHFSYQTVDKTLTFHFLRATLELPTGQHWPRGNICLGGSLCRKLKKKR